MVITLIKWTNYIYLKENSEEPAYKTKIPKLKSISLISSTELTLFEIIKRANKTMPIK